MIPVGNLAPELQPGHIVGWTNVGGDGKKTLSAGSDSERSNFYS